MSSEPSHPPVNIFQFQSPAPISSISPTPAPTLFDPIIERIELIKEYLILNQYSTETLLSDARSPQYMAALHLASANSLPIPTDATDARVREDFKDRWVLMVLFYTTGGPRWRSNWNIGNHDKTVCDWNAVAQLEYITSRGAYCNEDSTIGSIDLSSNILSSTLPTEIALLSRLDHLNLKENALNGTLPIEMEKITNMVQFEMNGNDFSGTIPAWLSKMTKLESLYFSDNSFTGTLPDELYEMTSLLIMAVNDNNLHGRLDRLNNLTNLLAVYAEDNDFSGTIGSTFFSALTNLQHLDLSNNDLRGGFPPHLLNFPNLTVIDLHGNFLNETLPESPVNNMLRLLSLFDNDIPGTVPLSISNLQALSHLDLTTLDLEGTMPEILGNLTNLEYLFLAGNDFDAGPIPATYEQLTSLRDFSVKGTQRTGPIPTWLSNMDQIILLDLGFNAFVETIPTELGDMFNLTYLLLNKNQLTGTISLVARNLTVGIFDHNNLSDNTTALCAVWNGETTITADCNGPNTTCSCCALCCLPDDDTCLSSDLLALFDPVWEDGYLRVEYDFVHHHNITSNRRLGS